MITLAAAVVLLPGCASLTPAGTENTSTPHADATDAGIIVDDNARILVRWPIDDEAAP